ncbi:MAG: hypothetical protein ABRQ37_01120 [Candidatus Eremiobacterota bacterium]
MKKSTLLLLAVIIMSILLPVIVLADNEIKDFSKLVIYIKNKEYNKKSVYQKDGELYTSLDSLSKALNFKYVYEKSEAKLYVNGEEYKGVYSVKGDKVYASLKGICESLGYYTNYNASSHIMDISSKPISTITTQSTPQANTIPYTGHTGGQTGAGGTIVPGSGIQGKVYVGTNLSDARATLGEELGAMNLNEKTKMYMFGQNGEIALFVQADGIVRMIMVTSPGYKTTNGISIGASMEEVVATYGNQYFTKDGGSFGNKSNMTAMAYPNGIVFLVDNTSKKVSYIAVFSLNYPL